MCLKSSIILESLGLDRLQPSELFFVLVVVMFHFFLNSFCHDCQCGLEMMCFVQEPKL